MPQSRSPLAAKYGAKLDRAVTQHANDPVEMGRMSIPAGIQNGVAQITKAYFAQYKTGKYKDEYYFRAEGTVIEPESIMVNGREVGVQGLFTSIMRPVCETRTEAGKIASMEDNVRVIENDMKLLGIPNEAFTGADALEQLAQAIQEARPFFKFETSVRKALKPGDPDGVWENWYGVKGLEDYSPPGAMTDTVDNTPMAPQTKQSAKPQSAPKTQSSSTKPPTNKSPTKTTKPTPAPALEPADPEPFNEFEDSNGQPNMEALLNAANALDETAHARLTELAIEAGYNEDDVKNAQSWDEVAEMVANPKQLEENGEGEWKPSVGDVFAFEQVDAKTKTKKSAIEIEIISVDEENKTVTAKDNSTKKTVLAGNKKPLAISWDELLQA